MLMGEGVYVGNQTFSGALSNIQIMTVTVTVTVTLNIARRSSKCTVYNAQIHSGPVQCNMFSVQFTDTFRSCTV